MAAVTLFSRLTTKAASPCCVALRRRRIPHSSGSSDPSMMALLPRTMLVRLLNVAHFQTTATVTIRALSLTSSSSVAATEGTKRPLILLPSLEQHLPTRCPRKSLVVSSRRSGMTSSRIFMTRPGWCLSSSKPTARGHSPLQYSNYSHNRHHHLQFHSLSGKAFGPYKHLDKEAVTDLFYQYAQVREDGQCALDANDIVNLLKGIGEHDVDDEKIEQLFQVADLDGNGVIDLEEFWDHADTFIGDNPARIILVIGGPGSGKGVLSRRLETECNVVHLSSGSLLREEVQRQTPLGRQVQDIMASGQLVSSAIMVALMKKRMRDHPGKRVLLDGFPRSLENAHDLVTLCGKPELALHLVCDDTILMERIMKRGENRQDDNFETALNRIRTYHKYHHHTLDWLREQHVPIVNLDCTGPPESVWQQMTAIGKLMRPAVNLSRSINLVDAGDTIDDDWSNDPQRSSSGFL